MTFANRRIVCICGSMSFVATMREVASKETAAGNIVVMPHSVTQKLELKATLDSLHRDKIRMADEVLIVDLGGYIGKSTQAEIDFAKQIGRPIRYWTKEGN